MRRKQHNGLHISADSGREERSDWRTLILCGVSVFALARLTGLEASWLPVLSAAVVCALGRRFPVAALALTVLSLLIGKSAVFDGFCQWYNGVGAIYTAENGIVLPALEASELSRHAAIFALWAGAAAGVAFLFLSRLGTEAVCSSVMVLCAGASFVIGRMIDPLPLFLTAAMTCSGQRLKQRLLPLGIVMICTLAAFTPGFSHWSKEQSALLQQQIHARHYETRYTTLPEGRLEPLRSSDATALVVTMDKPEVLYLRGFTGARIEKDRWMPLDNAVLAQNSELLYWLNSREFDLRAQFERAAAVLEAQKNTVTVQNVGACRAYRYIPFSICADDALIPENLTQTESGAGYDTFTTVYGGTAMLPDLLAALEADDSRYRRAEAAYREFVKSHYLAVPEEMAEKLLPYWNKAMGLDPQSAVKAVLADCYPAGVRHDPYYATAAVLTLRHFGIPARYAEGYILPQTTATTVELTGEHAACWAEVYHDGLGWLPMALTPGLDSEQQQEQTLPPDTPEETLPPETEPTAEQEPDGGYRVRIVRVILSGVVITLLLLILAAAALLMRRAYLLKKRQMILEQEDIREAVTWSFADSIALLEYMGIHRKNGSLDALDAPIRERFGAAAAAQFEAAARLNAIAIFSSHHMTEQERQTVHGFRSTVLTLLRQNTNRLQRFRMQYILCLF